MVAPLVVAALAAGAGVVGYRFLEAGKKPEVQSSRHTAADGTPVQVVVPVSGPRPQMSVSTVPIAGINAQVIRDTSPGAAYSPPAVVKSLQTPGKLDLLPTVITPSGAASLAVITVADVQNALNTLGYGPLVVDGKAGQATQAAVRSYQGRNGLVVDGSAGPQTKSALQNSLATLAAPPAQAAVGAHPVVATATKTTPVQAATQLAGMVGGTKAANTVQTVATVANDVSAIASLFKGEGSERPRKGKHGDLRKSLHAHKRAQMGQDPLLDMTGPGQGSVMLYGYGDAYQAIRERHVETMSDVQKALNMLGASPKVMLTGKLDPRTVAAVRVFQVTHGMLADGVPGPKTRTAMQIAVAQSGQNSDFGLTLFTLFGSEPPPVGSSRFGGRPPPPTPYSNRPGGAGRPGGWMTPKPGVPTGRMVNGQFVPAGPVVPPGTAAPPAPPTGQVPPAAPAAGGTPAPDSGASAPSTGGGVGDATVTTASDQAAAMSMAPAPDPGPADDGSTAADGSDAGGVGDVGMAVSGDLGSFG
jgi:peptidoglycan hydrolase-like protein with peptidoglycan-binding domain